MKFSVSISHLDTTRESFSVTEKYVCLLYKSASSTYSIKRYNKYTGTLVDTIDTSWPSGKSPSTTNGSYKSKLQFDIQNENKVYIPYGDATNPDYMYGFMTFEKQTVETYSIDYINESTGGSLTYLWEFEDGTTSSSANPTRTGVSIEDVLGSARLTISKAR